MSMFLNHIQSGIDEAEQVQVRKDEVRDVLSILDAEISTFSGGKSKISIETTYLDTISSTSSLAMLALGRKFSRPKKLKLILTFGAGEDAKKYDLAEWEQPSEVYPIKLTVSDKSIFCNDRDGLVGGLQQVLADPLNGEIFRKIKL